MVLKISFLMKVGIAGLLSKGSLSLSFLIP
jgi:hypothetical protein